MFGQVKTAYDMGAVGVGATVYWGSHESTRQLQEVSQKLLNWHMNWECVPFSGATFEMMHLKLMV